MPLARNVAPSPPLPLGEGQGEGRGVAPTPGSRHPNPSPKGRGDTSGHIGGTMPAGGCRDGPRWGSWPRRSSCRSLVTSVVIARCSAAMRTWSWPAEVITSVRSNFLSRWRCTDGLAASQRRKSASLREADAALGARAAGLRQRAPAPDGRYPGRSARGRAVEPVGRVGLGRMGGEGGLGAVGGQGGHEAKAPAKVALALSRSMGTARYWHRCAETVPPMTPSFGLPPESGTRPPSSKTKDQFVPRDGDRILPRGDQIVPEQGTIPRPFGPCSIVLGDTDHANEEVDTALWLDDLMAPITISGSTPNSASPWSV